jgi:recombination protein RecT
MTTEKKPQSQIDIFRGNVAKMEPQFRAALPPQIQTEKFMRVVVTAVQSDPNLLAADQRSLFQSSMKAAQDGLIPDGREAALVVFNKKNRQTGQYEKHVQYMPMMGGILKKIRNSGELGSISANVVHEKDQFDYELGDEEKIFHKPHLGAARGKPIAVYAIARMKDSSIYREVMSVEEVEAIRSISRAKDDGPWKDHWGEMAKKTVLRRLSKRLPMSTDLDTVMSRDDDLYEPVSKAAPADASPVDITPPAGDADGDQQDAPPPAKKRSGRMAAAVDAAKQQQPAANTPPAQQPPIDGIAEHVDDGRQPPDNGEGFSGLDDDDDNPL